MIKKFKIKQERSSKYCNFDEPLPPPPPPLSKEKLNPFSQSFYLYSKPLLRIWPNLLIHKCDYI